MHNDIESVSFFEDTINLSKIGKYGKFINFGNFEQDGIIHHRPDRSSYRFTTSELTLYKYEPTLGKDALESFEKYITIGIENELKKDSNLQQKLNTINNVLKRKIEILKEKAQRKVDKLTEKPLKKAKAKFHFQRLQDAIKLRSEADSSDPS